MTSSDTTPDTDPPGEAAAEEQPGTDQPETEDNGEDGELDEQDQTVADTFPASDPPAY